MPRRGSAALAVLLVPLTLGTCIFPTERDDAVHVTIDPLPVLLRGTATFATARAWNGSQQLANVTFVWSTDDSSTATVDAAGHIVGIQSGTTMIRARAANFDKRATPGEIALRVASSLEIDSIRPDNVRYGEIITVYGVGLLDTLGVGLALGEGGLIPVPFTDSLEPSGVSHISYWVPPPARTAPLFYIGAGVFGFTVDTVQVLRRDLYEPNEAAPTTIDLETARPFPSTFLEFLLFTNPALAFEQLPRDVVLGVDWYRLSQNTQRDLTIVVSSAIPGTFQTFLTDQLTFQASDTSYHIGPDSWTFGPQSHACHGADFSPKEAAAESTIVALRDYPAAALHAIALYSQPGRYALTVAEGYGTAGKGIVRDAHEEDDYCNAADTKRFVLDPSSAPSQALRDTLTIDNPHDVDWFRFNYPGGLLQTLRLRAASRPFGLADSSDIDVYVVQLPNPGDPTVTVVGSSARPGSTEDISLGPLAAGEYYAVVTDFAGVPTRYALCIGLGSACNAFPAPSTPTAVEVQERVTRRARLEAGIQRSGPARVR